ncbi:hypothetical protein CR203_15520 [Salipaludibacillus neizhouensis]|uniref:PhnB-like domain-containing protein n=1 Tax=Salipaludibacillus neizhouensis TaxID=885475 RepID=A0A3A9K714_9BACI|nr:VOC family protein [Salipaludibacillus neizhouensis]RKL66302.1 hypothetical protein CR203_15520 [Salipaludibacillus neizhouensis]
MDKTQKIKTFLMFSGQAEEAMNFYTSLFNDSEITNIIHYRAGEAGEEGTVLQATFTLNGHEYMCIDSNVEHAFTFTPAISLFVTCETEEEINKTFEKLSQDGAILMPLNEYPFSKRYGWVQDRFGISWQLSL